MIAIIVLKMAAATARLITRASAAPPAWLRNCAIGAAPSRARSGAPTMTPAIGTSSVTAAMASEP